VFPAIVFSSMRAVKAARTNLQKQDVDRVKNAEMWLGMGNPLRAMRELQRLTKRAWAHPWSEQVLWRAAQSLS
jgi:predicted Zn-dependent protease